MVAAIVVVAAITISLVVSTGGSEDRAVGPTSSAPDSPSSPATTAPVPDGAIGGDGYYYDLPGTGWNDAFDEARDSGIGSTSTPSSSWAPRSTWLRATSWWSRSLPASP